MIVRIKPAVYSRRSTPLHDREYYVEGCGRTVGCIREIKEYALKKYGKGTTIVGKTLEGEDISEVVK